MTDNDKESIKRTLREKQFVEAYIDKNGNATEAYLVISPDVTRDSAKELGKRMLAKLGLSIVEILDEMGLSNPVLSKKLMEGLDAKKSSGKGLFYKETKDHTAIVKYVDMILKLKAEYPADRSKLELTGPDGQPLARSIVLREIIYRNCPLRDQCPIKEKVNQAENPQKEKDRNGEE